MRVTLIHNPDAGAGGPSADDLLSALRRHGYVPTYCPRDDWSPDRDHSELLVVAGGDGTVGSVAKRLAGRPTPLAAIPIGTANNIAASLGIDVRASPDELIAGWSCRTPRPFDVGLADAGWGEQRFVESVGCGLFADMMAQFQRKSDWRASPMHDDPEEELAAARQEMRRVLANARPRIWNVEVDGIDYSGHYLMVEVMNIRTIGPAVLLAPEAEVGDGLLDVVFVCDDDRDVVDKHLRQPASAGPGAPLLTVRRAREVMLDARGDRVHLDDAEWHPPSGHDTRCSTSQPGRCRISTGGVRVFIIS